VDLTDDDVKKIFTGTAKIKIFDNNGKKVTILDNRYSIDGSSFTFSVANQPYFKESIVIDGKKLPVVDNWYSLREFYIYENNDTISVPIKAIHKDEKGEYVWQLVLNPNNPLF
jgi:hypothetical protein